MLNIVLFLNNQATIDFTGGFQQEFHIVFTGVFKTMYGIGFFPNVPVTRCELVTKHRQGSKINLVATVCVCRVYGWLNVRGIVVQHIEDVMTFMVIRSKNAYVNWDMVRHQRILGSGKEN